MENIRRRDALKRTALIMGGILSAPTIAGILNGCTPKPELTWVPAFFNEDQARLIMELSETIIPETSTPGAKKLGVPGFIEEMVSIIYNDENRDKFMTGMEAFMADCKAKTGDDFVELSAEKRKEYCAEQNAALKDAQERGFFYMVKELTVVGYYTTEYGTTQALQYVAIPTELHGCVPLSEAGNGKAWAT